jgi:hypothetical protein
MLRISPHGIEAISYAQERILGNCVKWRFETGDWQEPTMVHGRPQTRLKGHSFPLWLKKETDVRCFDGCI